MVSNRKAIDTSGWLTRNESTDLLGVSANTLANHERRGNLHPQYVMLPDTHGTPRKTTVYDPNELAKLPRYKRVVAPESDAKKSGESEARCFELFLQGKSVSDIVILLRESSDQVLQWRERWLDTGGTDVVLSPEAKRAFEEVVGPFANLDELLDLVRKRVLLP